MPTIRIRRRSTTISASSEWPWPSIADGLACCGTSGSHRALVGPMLAIGRAAPAAPSVRACAQYASSHPQPHVDALSHPVAGTRTSRSIMVEPAEFHHVLLRPPSYPRLTSSDSCDPLKPRRRHAKRLLLCSRQNCRPMHPTDPDQAARTRPAAHAFRWPLTLATVDGHACFVAKRVESIDTMTSGSR